MKSIYIPMFAVILCGSSCKSDSKTVSEFALPKFWLNSCSNFFETKQGYTHEGRCCESILFPKFDLKRNQSFTADGLYSRNTESSGNNIIDRTVKVSGFLSADTKILTLSYEVDSEQMKYTLKTDESFAQCSCTGYFK